MDPNPPPPSTRPNNRRITRPCHTAPPRDLLTSLDIIRPPANTTKKWILATLRITDEPWSRLRRAVEDAVRTYPHGSLSQQKGKNAYWRTTVRLAAYRLWTKAASGKSGNAARNVEHTKTMKRARELLIFGWGFKPSAFCGADDDEDEAGKFNREASTKNGVYGDAGMRNVLRGMMFHASGHHYPLEVAGWLLWTCVSYIRRTGKWGDAPRNRRAMTTNSMRRSNECLLHVAC